MGSSENDRFDKEVDTFEMEMLNPSNSTSSKDKGTSRFSQRINQLVTMARLTMELYPRVSMGVAFFFSLTLMKALFFRHRGQTLYIPPHLANHYGDIQSYYDLQIAKVDHWCLKGGDDFCSCDDPTEALSREFPGWMRTFQHNKQIASYAPKGIDVVFLGDEFTQAWTGKKYERPIVGGNQIAKYFNQTFQKQRGANLEGIALGIADDTIPNLLYRIKNGEIPETLNPKVWWILIGANDLVQGECSEEAVVLGILRLADEIAMIQRPGSVVVIQGLLPRSSSNNGHITNYHVKSTVFNKNSHKKQYYRPEQYPLWPSINLINDELEKFCAKHEHLVYFDTSALFFGSLGNEHYQSSEKIILKELMPDYKHPSVKGYEILARVIGEEVYRIVYEDDEENHKASANEGSIRF